MSSSDSFNMTPRTRVRRQPARASYDRALANAILDQALVASVGFVQDGQPFVIPMMFAREQERLILHAASSGRFRGALGNGARICATVTLLDGLVLARSAMHHSMNYRSVVALGSVVELDGDEKLAALARLLEHVLPGRSKECRPPNATELKATTVFALPLDEVSVKQRQGGPLDDAADLDLPYWAGVVPLAEYASAPVADSSHPPRAPMPVTVAAYRDRSAPPRPSP